MPDAIDVPRRAAPVEPWYKSPIVWLVAAVVAAVLAACIATVLLAIEHADTPLDIESDRVLSVPTAHARDAAMNAGDVHVLPGEAIPQ